MKNQNVLTLILFYVSIFSFCFSAGPIMHAYLAYRWMDQATTFLLPQQRLCLLGTLFPDIRYLGTISRKETHLEVESLSHIPLDDPFKAGMLFHAWVDKERESFATLCGIYDVMNEIAQTVLDKPLPSSHQATLLKLVEDALLYDLLPWQQVCMHLEFILPQELNRHASLWTVTMWHTILRTYFSHHPRSLLGACAHQIDGSLLFKKLPSMIHLLTLWEQVFDALCADERMIHYVTSLITYFENTFKKNDFPVS